MVKKYLARMIAVILAFSTATSITYGLNDTEYYEARIKTSELGNYDMEIESHEVPSHEYLPIIGKEYFPYSVEDFKTEVDNTEPYAVYESNPIVKVDVVFALGDLSQQQTLQSYIDTFKSKLNSASNNLDTSVESVETSTLDLSKLSAQEILNTWYNYPGSNIAGYYSAGWRVEGNGALSTTENVNWTGFLNWTEEAKKTTDGTYEFTLEFEGGHQDPQGWTFCTTKHDDGSYSFYVLEVNQNYGNLNLACITRWIPSSGYPTHGGPYYHGCISGCDGTYDGSQKQSNQEGATGYHIGRAHVGKKSQYNIKIERQGSSIKVYSDNALVINAQDSYLTSGTYGPYTVSQWEALFTNIKITTGGSKSLGEAITDVAWRDGSVRFVIHATDIIPKEMASNNPNKEADFAYTVAKLLNCNAYLINLGTGANESALNEILKSIAQADGTTKGIYYYNNPIKNAMDKSAEYILDIARNLVKPTNWILVNTEVTWNTEYKDNEKDAPLNYGEHSSGNVNRKQPQDLFDEQILASYGTPITYGYTDDKILAEKWRYRHFPQYFDNSSILAGFAGQWIPDPVEVFEFTGKYRINYKRKDNPFHSDQSLTNIFDNYRYWSTNYDYIIRQ